MKPREDLGAAIGVPGQPPSSGDPECTHSPAPTGLLFGNAKRDNRRTGSASAVNAAAMATREARNEHDRSRDPGAPGAGRCQRISRLSSGPGHRARGETWISSRRAMSCSSPVVSMVEQLAPHLGFASQEGCYSISRILSWSLRAMTEIPAACRAGRKSGKTSTCKPQANRCKGRG